MGDLDFLQNVFITLTTGCSSKLRPSRGGLHQEQAQVLVGVHRASVERTRQGQMLLRGKLDVPIKAIEIIHIERE